MHFKNKHQSQSLLYGGIPLYSLHARKIMSTCNMIMLISNKNMSTYKMIMFTCDFNYAACQHNYVAF